tara:strand:- start:249 stop:590 length:342 start_codon:yes stop_codon:yes gene_type:complete
MTKIEDIANEAQKRNDKEFKENKKNINFILKGNNKYYYAKQCKRFTDLVTLFGYPYIDIEEIKKNGVSFNKYSINVGCSKDDRDLKKFSSTQELLGWVVGFCDGFAVVKRNLK